MNERFDAESYLLIRVGGRDYALPVSEVEGVTALRADAVSPVPFDVSGRIGGIFPYKGAVTALLRCPGLDVAPGQETLTAVVLCHQSRPFALPVDGALSVLTAEEATGIPRLSARELYTGESHEHHQ